jgi:hypothetical protein
MIFKNYNVSIHAQVFYVCVRAIHNVALTIFQLPKDVVADDMILYLKDPKNLTKILLDHIKTFRM